MAVLMNDTGSFGRTRNKYAPPTASASGGCPRSPTINQLTHPALTSIPAKRCSPSQRPVTYSITVGLFATGSSKQASVSAKKATSPYLKYLIPSSGAPSVAGHAAVSNTPLLAIAVLLYLHSYIAWKHRFKNARRVKHAGSTVSLLYT